MIKRKVLVDLTIIKLTVLACDRLPGKVAGSDVFLNI